MPAGVAFDDLLRERLLDDEPTSRHAAAASGYRTGTATATAYGFFFLNAPLSERTPEGRKAPPAAAGRTDERPAAPGVSRRVQPFGCAVSRGPAGAPGAAGEVKRDRHAARHTHARRLTLRQREALDVLAALGAPLAPDFTGDELRTAFRALARRYHPDRHPGSSEYQRTQLGLLFGHAYAAYKLLSQA